MYRGHIKLWRKIKDNELWKSEPFSRGQAWVDLILLANFEDGQIRVRGNVVAVKRGQVGWSILSLADRWKWSRGKVSRFLDELEAVQQIIQQKNRLTSLIVIVNYEEYQARSTTERATDSTTDGQQTDTKKNVKNVKKESIKDVVVKIGTFENVKLTEEEMEKLKGQFGCETHAMIDNLSIYIKSKGDKYKSHYATLLSWERKNKKEKPIPSLTTYAISDAHRQTFERMQNDR